jgi:hypothetical protein
MSPPGKSASNACDAGLPTTALFCSRSPVFHSIRAEHGDTPSLAERAHRWRPGGGARDAPGFIDGHNGRSERGGQEPGEPMVVLGLAQVADEAGSPRGP